VRADSDPTAVGDEPVLMARRAGCPIAVGPDRVEAARALVDLYHCDVLVSDDGLQHYRLGRDIEIAVVDGIRRFGNGRCLPAGPLREPPGRLRTVDLVVTNGIGGRSEFNMRYAMTDVVAVRDERRRVPLDMLRGDTVHAVAGIGYPERFFASLRSRGIHLIEHPFPDHYRYTLEDLQFDDELIVIMTEKDAVKCRRFETDRLWYLPIEVELPRAFEQRLLALMKDLHYGQETPGHSGVPGDKRPPTV
jgi:tetraacyldisaccharide 4'-kinase